MSLTLFRKLTVSVAAVLGILIPTGIADEGMWLFNNPPVKLLQQRYGFTPAPQWLEHLQKSSVRFNSGGSGSFVSPNGLVMTNHHVASDCLQKISTEGRDYIKTGFYAKSPAEEPKCVDLELNVLMGIEDVTSRVQAAVKPGLSQAESEKARRAVINTIEKESLDKTKLRSDVVTLYNGGQYHLYRYKKYTDVRLAFAPEKGIAFFGGDPDNFEYPRYDLDVTFFRAYENDKPATVENYLRWSGSGARDGDLVFVSGHPGGTDRQTTVSHLEYFRDLANPYVLELIMRREVMLRVYSERGSENARRAQDELFGIQNSRKAYIGRVEGLQDPAVMAKKREDESALKSKVMADPSLKAAYGDAWTQVDTALKISRENFIERAMLESGHAFNTELFHIARWLVRMADETAKPNSERLRAYTDSALESLKQQLFSEAPLYPDFEKVKLADSLSMLIEKMGSDNELVRKILDGKSPRERAAALIDGSRLADVAVRKKIAEGGKAAIDSSTDTMIALARLVDPEARRLRKISDEQVQEPTRQAYGKIANARFKLYGSEVYPDATFTLRLAFGTVKGYEEEGKAIPWTTNLGGAYEHAAAHENKEPFNLPAAWLEAKSRLKLDTPFNFVSTNDIIGGNSGSPVVNRNGELVGIIFDGNLESLVWDYVYADKQGRALSVHSAGILEALRTVYKADRILNEISPK